MIRRLTPLGVLLFLLGAAPALALDGRVLDARTEFPVANRSLELRGLVRNILDSRYLVSPDVRAVLAPGVSGTVMFVVQF